IAARASADLLAQRCAPTLKLLFGSARDRQARGRSTVQKSLPPPEPAAVDDLQPAVRGKGGFKSSPPMAIRGPCASHRRRAVGARRPGSLPRRPPGCAPRDPTKGLDPIGLAVAVKRMARRRDPGCLAADRAWWPALVGIALIERIA